ncbi:MAG: T9SS type A sorting domain-containing protein [Bacteroidales bacterium]
MKKIIYLILFFISSFNVFSQTTTFNKTYTLYGNDPATGFMASSVISKGNGYIVSGNGYDTINNNYPSLYFYKVDSIGNVSKIRSFTRNGWSHYYNISALIELKNGGYCYIGDMDSANHNPEHLIIRFDANMDTLWTKTIPNDTVYWEALRQMQETSDHGFVFIGSKEITPYNLGILIVKTDSLGNLLWKKTIAHSNIRGGARILETPDKGFLINGFASSSAYKDGDPYLLKTDSIGNVIWLKIFGGNEYDGAGPVVATNDGNYLYAYGLSNYTFPFNDAWTARLNIIKFAPNGDVIWNKLYDTIRTDLNAAKIQVLPNNDFIVMGLHTERDSCNFFISFLFKFTANGDSIWKKIYYLKDGFADNNALVDNVLNSDGSITACGWVSSDSQVPYQQIWLLKTDSNGYAPGPQNVSIIDLPYLYVEYGVLKVYPNPATTEVTLSYFPDMEKPVLEIYNSMGSLIKEIPLPKSRDNYTFSVSQLAKGYYKVILKDNGYVRGQAGLVIK